ncbi:DUF4339 domain-containing protein [Tenacibaculum holothuriorum]|uniref:DUF4339 domain-containing protein n=1 Tax=Tenacibaculum holothuriorum TaxID=1635173 RepID=UPI000A3247E3|nr:DUF4339 domain-containing protein [Tenacibaculum holothuriorum]
MKKYYIIENNEKKGPFSIEELREFEISFDTLIWTEGLNDWTEAKGIDELKAFLSKIPPPLPKSKKRKINTSKKTVNYSKRIFIGLILGVCFFGIGHWWQNLASLEKPFISFLPDYSEYDVAVTFTVIFTLGSFFLSLFLNPIKSQITEIIENSKKGI